MSVKVNLHRSLASLTNGQAVVEVNGDTVGQCLEQLATRFPRLKKKLFEKDGALSRILEIYVNGESAYPDELATAVKDGDELDTVVLISGG
ncbi:Sulfur carrier protein CysO [subsurface metagenome]